MLTTSSEYSSQVDSAASLLELPITSSFGLEPSSKVHTQTQSRLQEADKTSAKMSSK